jgi:preprotein translocase subunit SecF
MQIFTNTNFEFVKWRNRALIGSLLFLLAGIAAYFIRGVNVGIDFAGGASIVVRFQEAPPIDQIRSTLPGATIQRYGAAAENTVLIRLPDARTEGDYAGEAVNSLYQAVNPDAGNRVDLNFKGRDTLAALLLERDPDGRGTGLAGQEYYRGVAERIIEHRSDIGIFTNVSQVSGTEGVSTQVAQVLGANAFLGKMNVLSQETVGPQVGSELQRKALLAIILSTIAMGIYIAVRFDLKFGLGAIVALIHDVILAAAFVLMIGAELSLLLVAAFLMIIGYSVNDTVVTYDRVRENISKSRVREDFGAIINRSINQTLSRTVLTSGSTAIVLISLLIFGGRVIHDFAWILLMGVIIGTYSTLYVVPAFVIGWERWFGDAKNARRVAGNGAKKRASV